MDDLEDRLAAPGHAVAEIQQRLGPATFPGIWLDKFIGTFKDEPALEQVVALGREFSPHDYPGDEELLARTDQQIFIS